MPTPSPTIDFSVRCGNVGAESYTEPLTPLPPLNITLEKGKVITVSTNADIADGDVSSIQALLSRPGGEGISLREALLATNAEPGLYTIRFDGKLKGTSVKVSEDLPWLLGGNVIINGDVDGDGKPDITLVNEKPEPYHSTAFGLRVSSSGNTLHGIELRGFFVAVILQPPYIKDQKDQPVQDMTFADNTVSNLIIRDAQNAGILVHTGADRPTKVTRNRWLNTVIVGNFVEAGGGIEVRLHNSVGDRVEGTTIANNTVRITKHGFGINLGAGYWAGSNKNSITDTLIAFNSVEGAQEAGIRIGAGDVGGAENLIERVQIIGNRVAHTSRSPGASGIVIVAGDGATDHLDPNYRPITYPDNNLVRDIRVLSNHIEGRGEYGIFIMAGCCGARGTQNTDILVTGNVTKLSPDQSTSPSGIVLSSGQSGGYFSRATSQSFLSRVTVRANTVHIAEGTLHPAFLAAGIRVEGAASAMDNRSDDITIANNDIDTGFIGISIIGAWGGFPKDPPKLRPQEATFVPARANTVTGLEVRCNRVAGRKGPLYMGETEVSGPFKGINIAGGVAIGEGYKVTGNRVDRVRLEDNLVGGVLNDVSVSADLGKGASGNIAELP